MNGYLNLLILGYLPWVLLDWLIKYTSSVIAVITVFLGISWFVFQAIKEHDYIGITFATGFMAYAVDTIDNCPFLAIYSKNILLIVAIIAFLSLIGNKPFTIAYSKKIVNKDKWYHPLFIKINKIISLVWALIFLTEYSINIIKLPYYIILNIILVVLGIKFSKYFPEYYRNKIAKRKSIEYKHD